MIFIPNPPAPGRMGYIGRVALFPERGGRVIRAMSSTLAATQSITHPDVVDNRIDRTLYQLGPVEVGGDITLPVVKTSEGNAFLQFIWETATVRDVLTGELVNYGDVVLEYSHQQQRTFHQCRVNTLEMRCTAGDRVEATMNFLGTTADDFLPAGMPGFTDLSPARVLTWDNVTIVAAGNVTFGSCIVREFAFTISNNLSRNYTFCPQLPHGLFASNISTGKRFINGSLGFQGFASSEQAGAEQNPFRFTSTDTLSFDFDGFQKTFQNVIYEYQSINIDVGLITSSVNWYAHHGNDGASDFAVLPIP